MTEVLKTEYNRNYIKENDIIRVARITRLSPTEMMNTVYWTATTEDNDTLVKADYYTEQEIETIERLLAEEYQLVKRIASTTNTNIYSRV